MSARADEGARLAYVAMLAQTAASAGTYLVAKRALAELSPLEVAAFRFLGAALVYLAVLAALRAPLLPPRGQRGKVVLLGIIGLPFNQGLFLAGLSLSSASHAAILYALTPACVLVAERVVLGARLTPARLAGIGIAFAGVLLVLLGRGIDLAGGTLVGDVCLLGAVVAWAAYTIVMRPLAREHGGTTTTGWAMLAGATVTAPVTIVVLANVDRFAGISASAWGGVVYLITITSVVAYALWAFALRRLSAVRVAVFTNLQPVGTALLAWLVLGEQVAWPTVVGGLGVIAGVTLAQRQA
ncbi:MAG: DMT family transporter [Deltaproteobacteria bacterium]|nr:DMT family transporter [Deltaproteobacteria bacterium]